jgi:hypothetical protein
MMALSIVLRNGAEIDELISDNPRKPVADVGLSGQSGPPL